MTRLKRHAMAAAAAAATATVVPAQAWVQLTPGMTWANRAWGMNGGGGAESVDGVDVVFVDFEMDPAEVAALKSKVGIVSCYIPVGTAEGWRKDYAANPDPWNEVALGSMASWAELWLDIRRPNKLLALMEPRFRRAKDIGCDAIEIDNMDCYEAHDCLSLMGQSYGALIDEQRTYALMLAELAHSLDLAIIQKNAVDLVPSLHETFDAVITENCQKWNECLPYREYKRANKAHFAAEYLRESSDLETPVGVCEFAANSYPEMMVKYCHSNSGQYLCRSSEAEWSSCFQPSSSPPPVPEPEEPASKNELSLDCARSDLIKVTASSAKAWLPKKVDASTTTCMLVQPSSADNLVRLKFAKRKLNIPAGDVVRVYRVDGLNWSRNVATGAELLAELPGFDLRKTVRIVKAHRGSLLLLVYDAGSAPERKLFAKFFES